MAPVAGKPAEQRRDDVGDALATSSTFGLCLSPLIRSATTADSSDSIAPSMATVMAGESKRPDHVRMKLRERRMSGKPLGMPPKRVPIVSTGNRKTTTTTVPSDQRDDRSRARAS